MIDMNDFDRDDFDRDAAILYKMQQMASLIKDLEAKAEALINEVADLTSRITRVTLHRDGADKPAEV
jgi:uncharacterized protein YceH (UPF0502 family)